MKSNILSISIAVIVGIAIAIYFNHSSTVEGENQTTDTSNKHLALAYANLVSHYYNKTAIKTTSMHKAIDDFLSAPSENTLNHAKNKWIEARKVYGITEAFRFYGGPIDGINQLGEEGPEGLINSWPLNEAYIDYVKGNDKAGLINNLNFEINAQTIISSNQSGDDADVSTGWHAIEFLLWGQDSSLETSGTRPFTDFIAGKNNNDRRATYLLETSKLLLKHVNWLKKQWENDGLGRKTFLSKKDPGGLILTGLATLAAFELASERIATALDSGDPEDEHSCFSDQTHNDIRANFKGIQNTYLGINSEGDKFSPSISDLVAENNFSLNSEIIKKLEEISKNIQNISVPFDKMLSEPEDGPGKIAAENTVNNLLKLSEHFKEVGKILNWNVIIAE